MQFRDQFLFPKGPDGRDVAYLAGNSLGLQPKKTREWVDQELEDWAQLGVEGHFHGRHPWLSYHELLTASTARLVGALPVEVVVMNTLTVNLHLMMMSFYRPTSSRYRIIIEKGAFPSDQYAVASQARLHGFDPATAIVELTPRHGEDTLRPDDILATIEREGQSTALVLIGNVNYLTGQAFDIAMITRTAHAQGCRIGFDLAHGAGNLKLHLHDHGPDFAVWCSYKYINAGPGSLAGVFVHERHAKDWSLPRLAGWWGHDKSLRFKMEKAFVPIVGAEGWQLSNPPILQLAALRASMDIFDRAGMDWIRTQSVALTGKLEQLLASLPPEFCEILTPRDPNQRGAQLSLRIKDGAAAVVKRLGEAGVVCDFRAPDVIRVAPVALYNTVADLERFVAILGSFRGRHGS